MLDVSFGAFIPRLEISNQRLEVGLRVRCRVVLPDVVCVTGATVMLPAWMRESVGYFEQSLPGLGIRF